MEVYNIIEVYNVQMPTFELSKNVVTPEMVKKIFCIILDDHRMN